MISSFPSELEHGFHTTLCLCVFLSFKTIAYPFYTNDVGPTAQTRKSEDIPPKERLCKHKARVYKDASLPLPQLDINTDLKIGPTQFVIKLNHGRIHRLLIL